MNEIRKEAGRLVEVATKERLDTLRPGLGKRTKISRIFGLTGVDMVVIMVYPKGTGQEGTSGDDSLS